MKKIFIDGSAGTTGLRIAERLEARPEFTLIRLPEELRKDPSARKEALNSADVVFLCLPDDAAREAVAMTENPDVCIIDTSTAHRTLEGWTYGFPEIGGRRSLIPASRRIANPGCHASGFISLVAPLVENGILAPDACLSCFSLTGYSGGGKKMIAQYQEENRSELLDAPRMYGLTQSHKHLPEMAKICGLEYDPIFCPIVADFYSGMEVTVPVFTHQLKGGKKAAEECLRSYYSEGLVRYADAADADGLLSASAMSGRDDMQVSVFGNEDRVLLVSRFDNLGKGASGSAIQNMNLVLGLEEGAGLNIN